MTKTAQDQFEMPALGQLQHWTRVLGQAQQLIMERASHYMDQAQARPFEVPAAVSPNIERIAQIQADMAAKGLAIWERFVAQASGQTGGAPGESAADKDRRFADPRWRDNPVFDFIRQMYLLASEGLMRMSDAVDGLDPLQKEKLRFATQRFVEAASPSNFPFTNPQVIDRTIETGGQNLVAGLEHLLADLDKGQLTHTDGSKFEVGKNIATTPGKVVHETPLYQLIQYAPATKQVHETPLIIFPPWINRFYILDLNPQKSFVRWAVEQGLTVFMVSWKSADASMAEVTLDDYVLGGQLDAIDTVRDLLGVQSVHAIGYCVAGTTLAATLALLAARGQADKVASATFFTAQVDFTQAGDLKLFVDDEQLTLVESLMTDGFMDGRYMAATFNLLRGQDLIWSYVVNNYLLGQDYPQFDLLYWNGDTTNLPGKWFRSYLSDLYRDNRLVQPGGLMVGGTPIDLTKVKTPAYVQAGIEDHIAPPVSVWKMMDAFSGPRRFLLAGSGHIAGVVNPPAAQKYQYWTCDAAQPNLDAFRAAARETKGSWWPDWMKWIAGHAPDMVPATGARMPGEGKYEAIEDAPGRYVRTR
ncbi:MAG: class I poly(R)-hydroxyalkanoic acid synthase [Sphingobium sp.]|nr:class I poly(R)-hydroxyalkanoic acid synthase [Sphingobium sp.]